MLYVRIELWPGGDKSRAKLLQELTVSNVGGTTETGEYLGRLSHSSTFRGNGTLDEAVWKEARGIVHDRRRSPAHLVKAALVRLLR